MRAWFWPRFFPDSAVLVVLSKFRTRLGSGFLAGRSVLVEIRTLCSLGYATGFPHGLTIGIILLMVRSALRTSFPMTQHRHSASKTVILQFDGIIYQRCDIGPRGDFLKNVGNSLVCLEIELNMIYDLATMEGG